jgi:hypothetical protein
MPLTNYHDSKPTTEAEYLRDEMSRLMRDLASARLESANRLAAIRATLGAAADGESDPLAYLRDHLAEETQAGLSGSGL